MENLLHYVWQHKLYAATPLFTDSGEAVEILDPGLHNHDAGPDFFNAKVRIGGVLWVGNVELHKNSADWFRHRHHEDEAYDNVVLHVVSQIDKCIRTSAGREVPQIEITVPEPLRESYAELLAEEAFPPCYRVIPHITPPAVRGWLSALTVERLEEKTSRIERILRQAGGDWEQAAFATLARNFGFGVNSEAFERWALSLPLSAAGKHRDDEFQLEALFLGQAGLLSDEAAPTERRDAHFLHLQSEYSFLAHKFDLTPLPAKAWRFLRMRPQNFPHVRLSQLVRLYHRNTVNLSAIIEAPDADSLRALLTTEATDYWQKHYCFGEESSPSKKTLQASSLDLLLINTVAPLMFAYGRNRFDESLCERAFALLEEVKAERNHITRSWEKAGLQVPSAADSQALIQLRKHYCDRRDCLRCRFGAEFLRSRRTVSPL